MAGKAVAKKEEKANIVVFDTSIFEEDAGVGNEYITQ